MRPSGSVVQHLPFIQTEHDDHHSRIPDRTEFFFPAVPADHQCGKPKSENAHHAVHGNAVAEDHHIQTAF